MADGGAPAVSDLASLAVAAGLTVADLVAEVDPDSAEIDELCQGLGAGLAAKIKIKAELRVARAPTPARGSQPNAQGFPLPGGGRLDLGEVIGRGGFGVVHRAALRNPDGTVQPVAAKLLGPGATAREQEAFLVEIKKSVAVGARCTGVVVPIGAMRLDGRVCLLMELYEGSLADRLDAAGGALPLELTLDYGEQMLAALASLHGQQHDAVHWTRAIESLFVWSFPVTI
jgi:hypothetical protein